MRRSLAHEAITGSPRRATIASVSAISPPPLFGQAGLGWIFTRRLLVPALTTQLPRQTRLLALATPNPCCRNALRENRPVRHPCSRAGKCASVEQRGHLLSRGRIWTPSEGIVALEWHAIGLPCSPSNQGGWTAAKIKPNNKLWILHRWPDQVMIRDPPVIPGCLVLLEDPDTQIEVDVVGGHLADLTGACPGLHYPKMNSRKTRPDVLGRPVPGIIRTQEQFSRFRG